MKLCFGIQVVVAIVGFGVVVELVNEEIVMEVLRLSKLCDCLFEQMVDNFYVICIGDKLYRLFYYFSFCIVFFEGEIVKLDNNIIGKILV